MSILTIVASGFCCFYDFLLQLRQVSHDGCVNRIRAMTQPPYICASWADTGHVQVNQLASCFLLSCCISSYPHSDFGGGLVKRGRGRPKRIWLEAFERYRFVI